MANPYYGATGNPPNNTRGISVSMRNEFQLIQAGFDASYSAINGKGAIAGQQWMGIQDFSTATSVRVPTPTMATEAVNKAYADGLSFSSALPAQAGNAGKFITTNGSTASWASIVVSFSTIRSARTSNTTLAFSDNTSLIAYTSGTFTQTFAAAAALGNGWYCWLQNQGTGDITLDPNGSELIDGLTSYVMYPGEVRFVQCDGTKFSTYVIHGFSKTFTASGTFIKPPGYLDFEGELWNGGYGGSGGAGVATSGFTVGSGGFGGPSGAWARFSIPASLVSNTENVVVGAGGIGGIGTTTTSASPLGVPGASSFGSLVSVVDGQGGFDAAASGGTGSVTGSPTATPGAANEKGGGGGGGGGGLNPLSQGGDGGASKLGGKGGKGGAAANSVPGNPGTKGVDGDAPGGGGGAGGGGNAGTGGDGGTGGRGEVRIRGVA